MYIFVCLDEVMSRTEGGSDRLATKKTQKHIYNDSYDNDTFNAVVQLTGKL